MAKWKELGEVPDSDDESTWDSQDSLPNPLAPTSARADATEDAGSAGNACDSGDHGIWNVPFSSQTSIEEREERDGRPGPEQLEPVPVLSTSGSPAHEPRPESAIPLSSLFDLSHGVEQEMLGGSPTSQHRAGSEESVLPPPLHLPERRGSGPQESEQATDEGGPLARSLRPRKPIQEHPYLLENVQYNKTWKSHGLRPVRVLVEEKKKRQEEDSQEQDFEDESQATSKGIAQEESEESQASAHFESHPEIDDVPLSDDGEPSPTQESNPQTLGQAIQSSLGDDDEFPDPNDVEKWKQNKTTRQVLKRHPSPKASSKRKLPRLSGFLQSVEDAPILPDIDDIFNIPVSPPQTSPGILVTTPVAIVNRLGGKPTGGTLTPKLSSEMTWQMHSPAPAYRHSEHIDLTALESGESENDSDVGNSHTASENEPDQVRLGAKRIRGVLPASWLRLDQKLSMQKTKPMIRHRSPDASPERLARKGVAQRRFLLPHSESGPALFLPDDSDDSDSTVRPEKPDIVPGVIPTLIMEDDAVSVIEEDHIDSMFSRGKRTTTGSSGLQKKRKRGQQPIFSGQPSQRKHQQRITSSLGRAMSISSTRTRSLQTSKDGRRAKRPKGESGGKRERMKSRPPQLSILDVVEPSAPAFIRIAARTASRRPDRGRSSPSRKAIMLGTRQDTIDAVEVLKRWNDGMIQPRDVVPPLNRLQLRRNEKAEATQARPVHNLGPPQNQVTGQKAATRFYQPRRLVKQVSMDNFVEVGTRNQPSLNVSVDSFCRVEIPRPHSSSYRPAQLEMAGDTANRSIFDARKRVLDALYRQSRKSSPTPRNLRLEQLISSQVPVLHQQPVPQILNSLEQNNIPEPLENRRRARFRKQVRPQSVDVSAPQYTHANDPLPRELSPPTVAVDLQKSEEVGKLLRLAPYGTHYTQHFEVFPLDRGVFFHESTIVGSGRLKRALDSLSLGNLDNPRGRCILTIDEHVLHWGPWDAQVSSELGILSDWVMERLDTSSINTELETTTPLRAVNFILVYLQDYLSFDEPESSTVFAGRLVDILQTFERRLKEIFGNSRYIPQSFIEVVTRILVIAVQILRLCQKLNKHPESFQVEEILKRLGTTTARLLLQTNLKEVHDIYGRLQHMPFREEGIRENEYALICWVTLIRIFEEARLPRAGFWEVVSPAILGPDIERTFDATVLERAWRTLFTLLPLGEFDTTGVTVSRLRHTAPLEGWTIPQRLLQRVFQLYGSNSRQSPSFNDYLRAVVGRCHYLVEQWGWYKCNAILGTVFDFFAAQDLRNLRNEEVYQSPQFLEELSGSPLLATLPEDRCFHIFLKLIAMSIQRLRKINLTKEIRNLVARLQPNHSRQYDKVMATYEADIAALRNHHDLLCTLFWAAPADLRPSLQSIEGLVVLGSSHKEACLINLRAWNRLSRFIVSTCGDISEYKTLADWQRNISQQVLEQFLSVETEVNQQLLGMSAEACKNITQQHKNAVISQNKKVAMDLLYSSMKSFLEVIHHTQTLGAVSFALNAYPLEQILTRLSFSSGSSDWSILKAALDILDYFLVRIDGFTSAEPMHLGQSWHEEDAIMLLERKFALPLITVVRDTVNLNSQYLSIGQVDNHKLCVEQAVALVGRIGACLIHARLVRLRQFFQAGGYNLFQDMLKPTTSTARKYVALFLATIVDRGVVDFKDLGVTPLNLFLAEITKPFEFLAYESRLAMSFKQLGETYLGNSVIDIGKTPNYNSNGDLFNCILIMMRKTLHQADPSQKLQLQNTFSKALRSVMDRMKADLKLMALNSAGHMNYVEFVRLIIGTIRSQDLCPVDSFFYQISQEYSPSRQDPRLQTAAILSWGLKLEEGDTKAISGLFYLLFPSFKIALANGELGNEANILTESMKHVHVFSFMLSTMLPAIIKATTQVSGSWILIETYVEAIDAWLSSACVHRQIGGDIMADVLALYTMVLEGAGSLQTRASLEFRNEDIVALTAMIKIANLLSSSVTAYLINEPESPLASDFAEVTNELTGFARAANASLSDLTKSFGEQNEMILEPVNLFKGLRVSGSRGALQPNEQINRFSSHIVQDIRNNWVSNGACITIKGPSRGQRPSSTQSGQGTSPPQWERRKLLQNLREQVRTWNHAHGTTMTKEIHERFIDELLF